MGHASYIIATITIHFACCPSDFKKKRHIVPQAGQKLFVLPKPVPDAVVREMSVSFMKHRITF